MTPLFIDTEIIGPEMTIAQDESNFLFKVKRSRYVVKIPFTINDDISYLSGVILGDGNMTLIPRKISIYPRVKLKIYNSSKTYLLNLNNIFNTNFSVHGKIYKKKDKECFILEINNKIIWMYFRNLLEIEPKRKEYLRIPKAFQNKDMFRYFLAGLFDTDGYLSKKEVFGIMMTGKNENFLKEVVNLSEKFHGIQFKGPQLNKINVGGKVFIRAYINLSKNQKGLFIKNIPLLHPKYIERI